MSSKTTSLPDGFGDHSPEWHFDKFVEFTELKKQIGEPSPHLAIVGHMTADWGVDETVWMLGCYGATYCLPSAEVIYDQWSQQDVLEQPDDFQDWLTEHWKGITTRTERRCVRTPPKMARCLVSYAQWQQDEFPKLPQLQADSPNDYYDKVFKNMTDNVYSFGRYITIRVVEGLRRYAGIPAMLYDVRSVGGWSPKKAMVFMYPEHSDMLLTDTADANQLMDELVEELIEDVQEYIPDADSYRIAAMLCEYRGAYENRHQYVGWTIDQEPLLYDKTAAYWGDDFDSSRLWEARKDLFQWQVLGEHENRWHGTRWPLTKILRDHGYNWTDLKHDYIKTLETGDFSKPVLQLWNEA